MHQEIEYLYGLRRFGIKPGLEAISRILDVLGNPHRNLRVVHVAGTNGKGSVCAMVADVLQRAGYKVGLFTSPHLVDFCERIQVDRVKISEADVLRLISRIRSEEVALTFFEFSTAMALVYFAEKEVDFAVLEVGMGGSWDSTNICDGEVCAITSIGLDHTKILGGTVEKIAKDKCGIIKKKSIVVTGVDNKALGTIRDCAKSNRLIVAERYCGVIGLAGEFQEENAGIAFEVCRSLGVEEGVIRESIANVFWPGRLHFVEKNLLVDCGHNPDAISAVMKYVRDLDYRRLIVVFGVLEDKDYRKMIRLLPKMDFLILTKPDSERALDPVELAKDGRCAVVEDPAEALRFAKGLAKEDDLIFVTGSIYLVGNIMGILGCG